MVLGRQAAMTEGGHMNGMRERRVIIAATLAYVETFHDLDADPLERIHARDHAHFAAYSAALTAGMHQDQAHDLATDIDELVTAVLAGGDDAAGGV
jgi:hypothetical protein